MKNKTIEQKSKNAVKNHLKNLNILSEREPSKEELKKIEWILDYQWNVMDSHGQRETMKDKINEIINQINYISRKMNQER